MFLNAEERLTETGADITLSDRLFQMVGPATGKARPPAVDSFTDGTSRRLVRSRAERTSAINVTLLAFAVCPAPPLCRQCQ